MKIALITGCTGQDGSYLTEFLLAKGYEVHGLKRRASSLNTDRLDHIYQDTHEAGSRFFLHYADLTDGSSLATLLYDLRPDEIYNLGAQSHVKVSFEVPEFTADVVAGGTLRLLEAMRRTGVKCRFYQASSSEMFGSAPPPQSEATAVPPSQPLRLRQGLRAQHHGELSGELWAARVQRHSVQPRVSAPRRDLRDAQDHPRRGPHQTWRPAEAVPGQPGRPPRLGLRSGLRPRDVADAATGSARTILSWAREKPTLSVNSLRLPLRMPVWIGRSMWMLTPATSVRRRWITCCADASKARRVLGWEPTVTFDELVRIMVEADMKAVEARLKGGAEALQLAVAAGGRQSMIGLQDKRIVVTGGAGFLGSHLMRRLEQMGCRNIFVPVHLRLRSHAHRCR